ncbi:alpha/beta hydrolase [Glutamicibacter uratoxydans]|uniref:Alpha/beta hydrolase n=1 Tax=Glutamicibacter uratoxydans TaxID=43667 RepID=A0A4Y4DR23_GLUUR|nr:alpha/beta hydrolase [Glutamicibacter uratoxydans]GED07789.1 alpha/beta hydrolase [Glutamicibacter uratoxydans]
MPLRPALFRVSALAAALALGLSSCSTADTAQNNDAPAASSSTEQGSANPQLEKYYSQGIDWEKCGSTIECASIDVPLNYDEPEKDSIKLALNRRAAEGAQGNLLVNPGGPGGSGIDLVTQGTQVMFSNNLQRAYNIIGFDPRGVGESTRVICQSDKEVDEGRQENLKAWEDADRGKIVEDAKEYADACAANTGELLGHVDTASAAKDMDIIRAVLGDDKLDYLGYSYGTFLGATYADIFPDKVGRLVLDGAMDPTASGEELTLAQAQGFEGEIDAWLENCLEGQNCPFTGSVEEAKKQLQDFLAEIEQTPMTASDGRSVPIIDFVSGFILPLYDDANWPYLTNAMAEAVDGNVDQMLYFSDLSADRGEDGKYKSNSMDVLTAVNCLDRPMDASEEAMDKDAAELEKASPTLGKYLAYGQIVCDEWDFPSTGKPEALDAAGSADILVVGTTGDPATPYKWSQSLADQLENGHLLTYNGHGHTAYGRSNQCITDAVDNYLIDGKVPADGTTC